MARTHLALPLLAAALALGCGSKPPATVATDGAPTTSPERIDKPPTVEAEVGAMSEEKVASTFRGASDALMECLSSGSRELPYLGGTIRFRLIVDAKGKALTAHLKESTLGHRATERCMLEALRTRTWPAPVGGRTGIAETEFAFDPPGGTRPPVALTAASVGKAAGDVRGALASCGASSRAKGLAATLYVDPSGKVLGAGLSGSDPSTEEAADCVMRAIEGLSFPSPGSWVGKLTVRAN
jgi:hypothetical protein